LSDYLLFEILFEPRICREEQNEIFLFISLYVWGGLLINNRLRCRKRLFFVRVSFFSVIDIAYYKKCLRQSNLEKHICIIIILYVIFPSPLLYNWNILLKKNHNRNLKGCPALLQARLNPTCRYIIHFPSIVFVNFRNVFTGIYLDNLLVLRNDLTKPIQNTMKNTSLYFTIITTSSKSIRFCLGMTIKESGANKRI
jgi:hypothetical protein